MPYPYDPTVPTPAHLPSQDVSAMQTNAASISGLITVDHVGFGPAQAGQHNKVTFAGNLTPPAPPIPVPPSDVSVMSTRSGVALPAAPQLFWKNTEATFHLSPIRAWATANGVLGGIIAGQSFNVTSVTRNSTGNYTVVMPAGIVNSANYAIIATCTNSPPLNIFPCTINYQIIDPLSFTITTTRDNGSVRDVVSFSFMVLQI